MNKIKLLVVDDSALMRKHLVNLFEATGEFLVETSRNGQDAIRDVARFQPDVVTLDINMPDMDGLTALSHIMVSHPCPVVMVSSLTAKGTLATLEALSLGAVDYLCKPGGTISLNVDDIAPVLLEKVRTAAKARVRKSRGLAQRLREQQQTAATEAKSVNDDRWGHTVGTGLVVIGVSTGGPRTLEDILPLLPANFPWPIVVAQHMPQGFTAPFAERMDSLCALKVVEVSRPMTVEAGHIYIARGGADAALSRRGNGVVVISKPPHPNHLWHPSVDALMRSALLAYSPQQLIGVLLTGMGYDGAETMAQLHAQGGKTLAESEQTAVVFGMPAELIRRGGASAVAPSDQIARQLLRWFNR